MSDFTVVGRLFKAHGVKGELKCDIEIEYLEDVLKSGILYVQEGKNNIPYFIEDIRSRNPFLIKLETIDTKEEALLVAHKEVRVPTEILSRIIVEESDLEFHFLSGYQLIDVNQGKLGQIDRVEEYPQQEMAFIRQQDQEFLIPLHKQMIKEVDKASKTIRMELPEGLLNMSEEE